MRYELEQQVLGAMLLDPDVIPIADDILVSACFGDIRHQRLFDHLRKRYASGEPIDIVTMAGALSRDDKSRIAFHSYLIELGDAVATSTNIEYHAKKLREEYGKVGLHDLCLSTLSKLKDNGCELEEVLEGHEAKIFQLASVNVAERISTVQDVVTSAYTELTEEKDKGVGLDTGYYSIDSLCQGFRGGDYLVVAGRPSVGKTALMLCLMRKWLLDNKPCLLFTLETTKIQIAYRLLSIHAKIKGSALKKRRFTDDQMEQLTSATAAIHNWPLYIDDSGDTSILHLCSKARRLHKKHDLAVVFVDYLQLVSASRRYNSRNHELEEVSGRLRILAKELGIPVVAVSQLRRIEDRDNKRPRVSDLRESGAIEQDATHIFLIYRPEIYGIEKFKDGTPTDGVAEVEVGKNRDGPIGITRLTFLKDYTRFENYSKEAEGGH